MKFDISERNEKRLLIAPTIIVLALFTTLPYVMTLVLGLFHIDAANMPATRFIGLKNYYQAFIDTRFWNSILVTGKFVVVSVFFEVVFGVGVALLFKSLPRGRGIFQSILLIPMVVPPIVVGLDWRLLLDANYGVINWLLPLIGLQPQVWLSDPSKAIYSLAMVDIWQYTPFVALLSLAILVALPKEPYEAAELEGANYFQILTQITLPLMKSGLRIIIMLRFIECFKDFGKIYTLTAGGPGISTETLNFYVYINAFENYKLGYSSALAIILFILIMSISVFMNKNKRNKK
jgi:multiple sugar transport system permease protein